MRILLADDDRELLELLSDALTMEGHEVLQAQNGTVACQYMVRESEVCAPIDLLVTDVLMPEQDGLEVIACFRKKFPGGRVIAISGGSDRFNAHLCTELAARLGADIVLRKPFILEELLHALTDPPSPPAV